MVVEFMEMTERLLGEALGAVRKTSVDSVNETLYVGGYTNSSLHHLAYIPCGHCRTTTY